jgi:hypothetical protein
MSADNWAQCPRCLKRHEAAIAEAEAAVAASYGKVSVEEFDLARQRVESKKAERLEDNFREDYEIYGAEEGVVTVTYGGKCTVCDLSLTFKHEHPLDVDGSAK